MTILNKATKKEVCIFFFYFTAIWVGFSEKDTTSKKKGAIKYNIKRCWKKFTQYAGSKFDAYTW